MQLTRTTLYKKAKPMAAAKQSRLPNETALGMHKHTYKILHKNIGIPALSVLVMLVYTNTQSVYTNTRSITPQKKLLYAST